MQVLGTAKHFSGPMAAVVRFCAGSAPPPESCLQLSNIFMFGCVYFLMVDASALSKMIDLSSFCVSKKLASDSS